MKANTTKLDETYRIHFEMSDGGPMGLEDIEADGFVLISMNGDENCCVTIHNTNLDRIAQAIARSADLRAAATLAEGYRKAHHIIKENNAKNSFADMLMAIGKDED